MPFSWQASSVHCGDIEKDGPCCLCKVLAVFVLTHTRWESRLAPLEALFESHEKQKAAIAIARRFLPIISWMLVRREPHHGQGLQPGLPPAHNGRDLGIAQVPDK